MKNALVLFSGGLDSFLSTCVMIEEGYTVYMVHYDNGCTLGSTNVERTAQRIIDKYGESKAIYLGTKLIAGYWRKFTNKVYSTPINTLYKKYGNLTISQLNCLTCRTAMYIYSILICKKYDISVICDGARRSQKFSIEQDIMISEFEDLINSYNIDFRTPVIDLDSDWERENKLYIRGIIPKTEESQCLLGCPVSKYEESRDVTIAIESFYNIEMKDKIREIISNNENLTLDNNLDIYL